MKEETKEEYLARIRKERGEPDLTEELSAADKVEPGKRTTFKEKVRSVLFMLLFALFLWAILQIFGMLKSN